MSPEMAAAVRAAAAATSTADCQLVRAADGCWRVQAGGVDVGLLRPAYRLGGGRAGWTAWTPNWLPVGGGRTYLTRWTAVVALVAALRRIGGVR